MDSQKSDGLSPLSKAENANRWASWLALICLITSCAGVYSFFNESSAMGSFFTVSGLSLVGALIAMSKKENITEGRADDRAALDIEKAGLEIEKLRLEIERLRRELEPKEPPAP